MANTSSAKKMVRKITRRTARNKDQRSEMRNYVRKLETAIESGDKKEAQLAFTKAQPLLARAGQKNLMHHRAAARKISRLSKRVNALS